MATEGLQTQEGDMSVQPQRAKVLIEKLGEISKRIAAANASNRPVRLVAVSKLKPANDILALHQQPTGHLYFGENYAQELQAKAELLPRAVRWCFIGALQTNKCKGLARDVPNLWSVSSVDAVKKADELDKGRKLALEQDGGIGKLRVHVQVNTSGEEEKSGVEPVDAPGLCRHIRDNCESLHLAGLMTIGAIARSKATTGETENADFITLVKVREDVCRELDLSSRDIELSMGMSEDFESAVRCGSDEVRVGSNIFGQRPARQDAKIKEEVEEQKS